MVEGHVEVKLDNCIYQLSLRIKYFYRLDVASRPSVGHHWNSYVVSW
jgi:hypothetical protein